MNSNTFVKYANNFTINDNNHEEDVFTFLRDTLLLTFLFLFFSNFIEGFENHLRRPNDNNGDQNEDDARFDIIDYFIFFD